MIRVGFKKRNEFLAIAEANVGVRERNVLQCPQEEEGVVVAVFDQNNIG